jgi:hypothetical protein
MENIMVIECEFGRHATNSLAPASFGKIVVACRANRRVHFNLSAHLQAMMRAFVPNAEVFSEIGQPNEPIKPHTTNTFDDCRI